MFSDYSYFLNETRGKVYSNQLRNCSLRNKTKTITKKKIHNTFLDNITFTLKRPWPSSLSGTQI